MNAMSRIRNGFLLAIESFVILLHHKVLLLYALIFGLSPFLSGNAIATILMSFISMAIMIFFHACLVHHVMRIIRKKEVHVGQTIRSCLVRWPVLMIWAMVNVSMRIILIDIIGSSGVLFGVIMHGFYGVWLFSTFFILPVITLRDSGFVESIKVALAIVQERWVELIGGHIGIASFSIIPLFLIYVGTNFLAGTNFLTNADLFPAIIVGLICICFIIIFLAAYTILQTVMYYHYYQEIVDHMPSGNERMAR